MIAVVTLLLAFPAGYRMRSLVAANLTYAVAYLWAWQFQTLYLLLDSCSGGDEPAFTATEFPTSYGLVTLSILLLGFGLVRLGHRIGCRRRGETRDAVRLGSQAELPTVPVGDHRGGHGGR